jgi:hypothetical protein
MGPPNRRKKLLTLLFNREIEFMRYSIQRQLSIAIENKPGRLAAVAGLMASHGINVRNLCVVDNIEQGVIRLIPSDPQGCKALLQQANYFVIEADVLVFILKDNPGQLEAVCRALDAAGVNIEYAYGSEDAREEEARIIIKVSNMGKAVQAVSELGG